MPAFIINDHLHHIAQVVEAAVAAADGLKPDHIMVVGAWCRDTLHRTLGRTFPTAATRDLDLALALSSWDTYRAPAASFRRAGNTGIRFRIPGEATFANQHGNWRDDYRTQVAQLHQPDDRKYVAVADTGGVLAGFVAYSVDPE